MYWFLSKKIGAATRTPSMSKLASSIAGFETVKLKELQSTRTTRGGS